MKTDLKKTLGGRDSSLSVLKAVFIIAILIIICIVGVYVSSKSESISLKTTDSEISIQSFLVRIVYSGPWNGTYFGWQGSNTLIAHSTVNGAGPTNRTISFKGNIYSGVRFDIFVQKDDGSSGNLSLYASTDTGSLSRTNSTTLPYGVVFVGIGVIS